MHDPQTVICSFPSYASQEQMRSKCWIPKFIAETTLFTLWHVDPCRGPGRDDSCGWFMRAHHGDKAVLERIIKSFEFDWDRTYKSGGNGHVYWCGLFEPSGGRNLSVQAIALNLFFLAANEHFKVDGRTNWGKTRRWMRKNLFDIMMFAENPTDSLFDTITRKFQIGCNEPYDKRAREEMIRGLASCIYGWILRAEQPWYKHPRWHIHHWRIQIHPWQLFPRWAFVRCAKCGGRFKWNESACSGWSGTQIWHDRCSDMPPRDEK